MQTPSSNKLVSYLAPLIAVVGLGLSLWLWQALSASENQTLQALLDARLRSFANLASSRVDTTEHSLMRMSKWWTTLQRTPRHAWAADAKAILEDSPGLEELHMVDAGLVHRWRMTGQSEDWALNLPVDEQRVIAADIQKTEAKHTATIANLAPTSDGTLYADIFIPLWLDQKFDGLIIARLNVSHLLNTIYEDAGLVSALDVHKDGNVIFTAQKSPRVLDYELSSQVPLVLHNLTLHASLRPTEAFLAENKTEWPSVVLHISLVLAVLVAVLAHQWLRISMAARHLRKTQAALVGSEEKIRRHRAHIETTYNTAPFGACFFDMDLRYLSINQRLAAFNGFPIEEHLGRTPREVRASVADQLEPILNFVRRSGTPVENLEIQAVDLHDSNSQRTWLCSYHPARDDNNQMIGIVASILDITSLREAEGEKAALSEQLHQSQKTEALGRLTGGIAHDFNNMLGVILGTLEFVADRVTDATLNPLITRIRQAAERAGDLTQRLLAFARQQPLSPRTVDVAALINNLSKLLVRSLGEAIDIRTVTSPDLWKAEVDPSQLESAILNLAINGRDAMPAGGKLTIEAANAFLDESYATNNYDVNPGDYVVISVTDTGTGMTPETIAKAFEPFFTTKEVGKGSGLGLSMVQGFLKQSQGHVKIYSEIGQGTVVKLYIPRAIVEQAEEARPVDTPLERGSEVIFVVEDDEMMRDTAVLLLQSLGYNVIVANSGVEAMPIIDSNQHIDILFTDIVMPGGIDGAELAEKARNRRPGLKVVYASGYTDNAITHQGRLPAGTHLVQKPYRRADLASKIRSVLDNRA